MKTNRTPEPLHQRSLKRDSRANLRSRRRGFTLLQIVAVIAVITILAAILMTVFKQGRATARRTQCDVNVKTIAIALDAYRQENGHYPQDLDELITKKYIKDKSFLHCPSDPRPDGSYRDFYIPRAPRNTSQERQTDPPFLVCPFHEQDGEHGVQAFTGLETKQFATRPAILKEAASATLFRPGETAVPAVGGMELHGGDRIVTGSGGRALIEFADLSTCKLEPKADITVLQSFMQGSSSRSTIYNLMHQTDGTATYTVTHGSNFDVVTPAATAGALGTKFEITVDKDTKQTSLKVLEGKVYLASLTRLTLATVNDVLDDLLDDVLHLPSLPLVGGLFG